MAQSLHLAARQALEHLAHPDCETACYRCLKSSGTTNTFAGLGTTGELESLAETAPEPGPRETGDVHDPRPWLEAYAGGVGSPLELKFLRLFESRASVSRSRCLWRQMMRCRSAWPTSQYRAGVAVRGRRQLPCR